MLDLDKWYVDKHKYITELVHEHQPAAINNYLPASPLAWGKPQNKLIPGKWVCFKSKTGKWRCIICGETAPDDFCLMADLCYCDKRKEVQLVIEWGWKYEDAVRMEYK